ILLLGHLRVTLPVLVFISSGFLLASRFRPEQLTAQAVVAFGGVVIAWLYWAWQAPRWRLWALPRLLGASGSRLLALAFSNGLLWPEGNLIERTELRGANYKQRLLFAKLTGALRRL